MKQNKFKSTQTTQNLLIGINTPRGFGYKSVNDRVCIERKIYTCSTSKECGVV